MSRDRWYYLTDEHFEQINRWWPPAGRRRGRPPKLTNREAVEGLLHGVRTGPPWRELPKAYGRWPTRYRRWQRWLDGSVWWNLLRRRQPLQGIELKRVVLASTGVRAHQHAAAAAKQKAIRPWVAPAAA